MLKTNSTSSHITHVAFCKLWTEKTEKPDILWALLQFSPWSMHLFCLKAVNAYCFFSIPACKKRKRLYESLLYLICFVINLKIFVFLCDWKRKERINRGNVWMWMCVSFGFCVGVPLSLCVCMRVRACVSFWYSAYWME